MSNQASSNQELQCRTEHQTEESEDPELAEFRAKLSKNFDVLPLYERAYNDFIHQRHYSLTKNEKLRSRWHERVMSGITRMDPGTMVMPNINDYHFHNCRTKFLPSQSQSNYPPPGFHLEPGPGVDNYGQRPIPNELLKKKPNTDQQPSADKKKIKIPKRLQRRSLTRGGSVGHNP